jgi:hypothetical protein
MDPNTGPQGERPDGPVEEPEDVGPREEDAALALQREAAEAARTDENAASVTDGPGAHFSEAGQTLSAVTPKSSRRDQWLGALATGAGIIILLSIIFNGSSP